MVLLTGVVVLLPMVSCCGRTVSLCSLTSEGHKGQEKHQVLDLPPLMLHDFLENKKNVCVIETDLQGLTGKR